MHEHDLDLIAALADGSATDVSLARSLVETCPVCRAEYEAHTEVLAWLAAAPAPAMTDLERAALHRDVRSGLGEARAETAGAPWWQRLGYVAAGLLVVVGLFGVLRIAGLMGGGDFAEPAASDATFAEEGADLTTAGAPATTTAEGPATAEDGSGGGESAPFAATSTTTAASTETTEAAGDAPTLAFSQMADEARASRPEEDRALSDQDRDCLTRAGLDRHVVVDRVEGDTTYLVVMPEDQAEEAPREGPVIFIELPQCRIVFEDR
jgi:hypothetical protein